MGARRLLRRLSYLLRRDQHDEEMAEEIRLHQELTRERLERNGLAHDDAATAARRQLGNVTLARDRARDEWGWGWLDAWTQDVTFALRLLTRERQFSLAVILALGLAIGLNNSVFTVINTALLRDVPFPEPHRLLDLAMMDANGREAGLSLADHRHWSEARSLEGISISSDATLNLSEEDRAPARLRGTFVTANTFALLRVPPIVGRDFRQDDEVPGAPAVAIIGYKVWQDRYAGNADIVGRSVRLNGIPSTIVGVMPESFSYPFITEVWQPLTSWPGYGNRDGAARPFRNVTARLSNGSELPAASTEIAAIVASTATGSPGAAGLRSRVQFMRESVGGRQARSILMTFMAAVGLVLLIACANVANLLLARAMARSREIAVRASLGATRWRIVRQLLIECFVLALCAGAVGLLVSFYGARSLAIGFSVLEPGVEAGEIMPFWVNLSPDAFVLGFIGTACLVSTLVFGLVPALHLARTNVNAALKEGERGALSGRGARLWTSVFTVAEVALTVMLLVGAGLLWRSFYAHYRQDLVVDPAGLVTARFSLGPGEANARETRERTLDRVTVALERAFGADTVTFASQAPLLPGGAARTLEVEGLRPVDGKLPPVSIVYVGPGYFETLGMAVDAIDLQGRTDLVIVDDRFAARYLDGQTPLGRRIRVATANAGTASPWLTVAGIVKAIPDFSPPPMRHPVVYAPLAAGLATMSDVSVIVRATQRASIIAPVLRQGLRQVVPDSPLYGLEEVAAAAARNRSGQRLAGTIFASIAGVGLLLSIVGVYAITAYGVAQRTREVGLRMALGARPREIAWLFVRRTALLLACGVVLGVGGAMATSRMLQSFLIEIGPRDPLTIAAVVLLLVVTALVASLLPSRRVARLDPMTALRSE